MKQELGIKDEAARMKVTPPLAVAPLALGDDRAMRARAPRQAGPGNTTQESSAVVVRVPSHLRIYSILAFTFSAACSLSRPPYVRAVGQHALVVAATKKRSLAFEDQ